MSIKFKFALATFVSLIIIMSVGAWYLKTLQTRILEQEARERVEIVLNLSHANREYVIQYLRPIIHKRLPGELVFEATSSTFFTSTVLSIFNKNMPEYIYKQPTLSPLNLDNQADEFEKEIIKKFQQNPSLEEITGYRILNGKEHFYFSRSIIITEDCLACHGNPKDAPLGMIERYGNTHGYYWKLGDIPSSLMVYIDTKDLEKHINPILYILLSTFIILTILSSIFIYVLFDRIIGRRIQEVSQVMIKTAYNPKANLQLADYKDDEIGHMVKAFNQMSEHLKNSFDTIECKNKTLKRANNFLAITAHDLKNPLSFIQGIAEMTEEDFDDMEKAEIIKNLSQIQQGSKQMFNLIINLLDINAIESGNLNIKPTFFNVTSIVKELMFRYELAAEKKNITLHLQVDNQEYQAFIDKDIVYQIFDNLISNAIKYSPFHKNVYLTLTDSEESEEFVRFTVRDEGQGLSEADQKQLFKEFSKLTTKPTGKEHSTGLGLFIVKKLVIVSHGRVWCESELNHGTAFFVELPKKEFDTAVF